MKLSLAALLGSLALAPVQGLLRGQGQRVLSDYTEEHYDYKQFVHIDFEDLKAGTILGKHPHSSYKGIEFSSKPITFRAMIFDSDMPTGEDWDLKDVNKKDGLGKMLIYSEDGNQNNPDDNAHGGTLTLTFKEPVTLESIGVKDNEESVLIMLYQDSHTYTSIYAPIGADGSFSLVWLKLI